MKKKLVLLLAGCMVLSVLGGCGKKDEEKSGSTENQTQTQSAQSTENTGETTEDTEFMADVEAVNLIDVKVEDYVTMGDYKGLKMSFDAKGTYTEADVEELALSAYSGYGGVTNRAAALGDTVNIDFCGKIDGVAFDGGTAQAYELTLGSGQFIGGFEDGLVGVKPGETVDLNLSFPNPYDPNPDLAGKPVVFTVTVNFILPTDASQMEDSVVASMGNEYYDTVEEFKQYCREYLEYEIENAYVTGKQNAALTALLEVATVNGAPDGLIKKYYANIYSSIEAQAAMYGMDVELFGTYFLGTDVVTYASTYAEESAKQSMVIQYVANAENLNISDEELDKCIQEFAEKNKTTAENVRSDGNEEVLREYFMFEKVLDFIVENGDVTEIQ